MASHGQISYGLVIAYLLLFQSDSELSLLGITITPAVSQTSVLRTESSSPVTTDSGFETDFLFEAEEENMGTSDLRHHVQIMLTNYKQAELSRFEEEQKIVREIKTIENKAENQQQEIFDVKLQHSQAMETLQQDLQVKMTSLAQEKCEKREQIVVELKALFEIKENFVKGQEKVAEVQGEKVLFQRKISEQWNKLDSSENHLLELELEKRKLHEQLTVGVNKNQEEIQRQFDCKMQALVQNRIYELESEISDREVSDDNFTVQFQDDDFQESEDFCDVKMKLIYTESDNGRCKEVEFGNNVVAPGGSHFVFPDVHKDRYTEQEIDQEKRDCLVWFEKEMKNLELRKKELDHKIVHLDEERNSLLENQHAQKYFLQELLEGIFPESEVVEIPKLKKHKGNLNILLQDHMSVSKRIKAREKLLEPTFAIEEEILKFKKLELQTKEEFDRNFKDREEISNLLSEKKMQFEQERTDEQGEIKEYLSKLQNLSFDKGTGQVIDYFSTESKKLFQTLKTVQMSAQKLEDLSLEKDALSEELELVKHKLSSEEAKKAEMDRECSYKMSEIEKILEEKEKEIEQLKTEMKYKEEEYEDKLKSDEYEIVPSPLFDIHSVRYNVIANQAAAELLKEILFASQIPELCETENDVPVPEETCITDGWEFCKRKKDVDILRKVEEEGSVHCFLGRGIIKASQRTVWEAVRNPLSRYIYDNILKKINIVEHLDNGSKIVYMLHETSQCFLKHSRDFCYVSQERTEGNKLVLASHSVDHPKCPQIDGIVRGQILSSGWVVEPIIIDDQECSVVWYLTRVDLGPTGIPSRLIKLLSQRQPLSIAYLRSYIAPL